MTQSFAEFLEAAGRVKSGAGERVEDAAREKAAEAMTGQALPTVSQEIPAPTPTPGPLPALPVVSNNAMPDLMSDIESIFALTPAQALQLKQELLETAFQNDNRSAKLKAIEMLTNMSALQKKDRIRHASHNQPTTTVFNVMQVMKTAQELGSAHEHNRTHDLSN